MRIKRILITLLVALMMFSLVAISSAAEEEDASFDIVTKVESAAAISDGVFSNTEDGIEINFSAEVKANPGASIITFDIYYDSSVMTFVTNSESSEIFQKSEINLFDLGGQIRVLLASSQVKSQVNSDLISLKFKLDGDFHGSVDSLKLENLVLGDASETNVTQTTFKAHFYSLTGTEPADCTTPAKNNYKCSKCDDTHSVIDSASVGGHKWLDASCEAPKTCEVCGETEGEKLPHNFAPATCTAAKTCKDCGATEGEKLAHDFIPATCTTAKTCKDCGVTEGEKLAHDYNAATCITRKTCKVCGATEGNLAEHSYGDWVETTKPTADEDGVETRTCSVCKHKETRPVEFEAEKNNGWIVAVVIIAVVVVCAGVVVGVVFYKKKKSY